MNRVEEPQSCKPTLRYQLTELVCVTHMRYPVGKRPLVFLVHQSLAAWGPILVAPWVLTLLAPLVWRFGWRFDFSQAQWVLYGTPYYPAQLGLALFAGWIIGGTLQHRQMLWVWVLPLLSIISVIVGVPLGFAAPMEFAVYPPIGHLTIAEHARLPLASRLVYLFGWGAGIQPFVQVAVTLPFYSAAAYSVGALLARRRVSPAAFFEAMRDLRVMRLIVFVGLPWSWIKLAMDWQQIAARYPEMRTWRGLFYILEGLWVMSIFVTFVFGIAVAVVGRHFFLSRFFLRSKEASPAAD